MTGRRHRLFAFAAFGVLMVVVAIALRGCGQPPRDVTTDARFGDFAAVRGTWQTKVAFDVVKAERGPVLTDVGGAHGLPVVYTVPAGSHIAIDQLQQRFNLGQGEVLEVFGRLVGGPHGGMRVQLPSNFFEDDVVLYFRLNNRLGPSTRPWSVSPSRLVRFSPN